MLGFGPGHLWGAITLSTTPRVMKISVCSVCMSVLPPIEHLPFFPIVDGHFSLRIKVAPPTKCSLKLKYPLICPAARFIGSEVCLVLSTLSAPSLIGPVVLLVVLLLNLVFKCLGPGKTKQNKISYFCFSFGKNKTT